MQQSTFPVRIEPKRVVCKETSAREVKRVNRVRVACVGGVVAAKRGLYDVCGAMSREDIAAARERTPGGACRGI